MTFFTIIDLAWVTPSKEINVANKQLLSFPPRLQLVKRAL